jgi:hypothetical protein
MQETYQALALFAPVSFATSSKFGFSSVSEYLMQVITNFNSSDISLGGAMVLMVCFAVGVWV